MFPITFDKLMASSDAAIVPDDPSARPPEITRHHKKDDLEQSGYG
jgi:hypothetical protein